MKNRKKYASILLAMVMCLCLAACGSNDGDGGDGSDDTAPDTIMNMVTDTSVEYDYSALKGTWLGENGSVLVMEHIEGITNSERFRLHSSDNELLASGNIQYVKEYGFVYIYNEHDGVAHISRINEDDTLYIDFFGTFTKVSGDVPGETIGDDVGFTAGGISCLEDLDGFWYPAEGIGSTISVLTCIYIDGTAGTWEEYDQYGDTTENNGYAYTDGTVLTLTNVPLSGDVEIPIGDAATLVTDTGETYWIKGNPDFKEKPELSAFSGLWYYQGDKDSAYATILTLNEDGTYTRGDAEEGTYTYKEYDEAVGETGTTVFRQEISLSGGFMDDTFYLVSDGQVMVYWANASNGDNYYIHEDALEDEQLLTEYRLTDESFSGESYSIQFNRGYTLRCDFFDGTTEARTGTWELSDDTVTIIWDDGDSDEATLDFSSAKILTLSSTGETLENLW